MRGEYGLSTLHGQSAFGRPSSGTDLAVRATFSRKGEKALGRVSVIARHTDQLALGDQQ